MILSIPCVQPESEEGIPPAGLNNKMEDNTIPCEQSESEEAAGLNNKMVDNTIPCEQSESKEWIPVKLPMEIYTYEELHWLVQEMTELFEEVYELGILKGTVQQHKPNLRVESDAGEREKYQEEEKESDDTGENDKMIDEAQDDDDVQICPKMIDEAQDDDDDQVCP